MQSSLKSAPHSPDLKHLLRTRDPGFWGALRSATETTTGFAELLSLNNLRKRALRAGPDCPYTSTLRVAVIGGASLHPLADLVEHFTSVLDGFQLELWTGDFDNYVAEISLDNSNLFAFLPDVVFLLPSELRCRFTGALTDPLAMQMEQADRAAQDILSLCECIHSKSSAQVILGNFRLPPWFDPGPMRSTSLTSEYGFRKYVNMQLGWNLPEYVSLCDIEFLANRRGTLSSTDQRTWLESKQPFSAALMVDVAREFAIAAASLRKAPKKVIVIDLDNTLWGGCVGDDGLEGIEIGTTSSVGEAFRDFQSSLLALSQRGFLLAVCSKNDYEKAIQPFEHHPEMILRLSDIVSFKANWEPKSDNIRAIAQELNLGLESMVFFDDSPAEVEILRQFVPEVAAICLGDDPSTFSQQLLDSRFFEQRSITAEDRQRTRLYQQEARRQELQHSVTDMDSYLKSLDLTAQISAFAAIDIARITQLINKSNPFNLTTRRRTASEVRKVMSSPESGTLAIRLADRFGDHGIVAIVICQVQGEDLIVDTWLMSCRVLKRQVEEETLNAVVELARSHGCSRIVGVYVPSEKNSMVRALYPSLGFSEQVSHQAQRIFTLDVIGYSPRPTHITLV